MKMSSLYTSVSGLNGAQAGLYVAGHNLSNSETLGYTRQRVLYNDASYITIGRNSVSSFQVGLGSNITSITNIRDRFYDNSYRTENSRLQFYSQKAYIGADMQNIFGELQGDYSTSSVLNDIWKSLEELSLYPSGLETRGEFISSASKFLDKCQNISKRLIDNQYDLDKQVRESVVAINQLVAEVNHLNGIISAAEASGDHANDYRDQRNLALDTLSGYVGINYKEKSDGTVDILTSDGKQLLLNGMQSKLGLKYTSGDYSFVEPVFTESEEILPSDTASSKYQSLYNLTGEVNAIYKNDNGSLKALLVCRGSSPVNYSSEPPVEPQPGAYDTYDEYKEAHLNYQKEKFNIEQAFIPRIQKEFDNLFHSIVKMINDTLAPATSIDGTYDENAPVGLDGETQHIELFVRKEAKYHRYDENGQLVQEDPDDYYSLYTIGNVKINPIFSEPSGYKLLPLSKAGDIDDNSLVDELLNKWKTETVKDKDGRMVGVEEYYSSFTTGLATETSEAISHGEYQLQLLIEVDNKRSSISGVSSDEELASIMKFQHTYNANARVLNMIDSFIDKIVNGTGRVGL